MKIYTVIDTNVIVAALYTKSPNSTNFRFIDAIYDGNFIPVLHKKILEEYEGVLNRPKFNFDETVVQITINAFRDNAEFVNPVKYEKPMIDESDRIFLETTLSARKQFKDVFLVTGNKKHFPKEDFILSPKEILEIAKNKR